MFGNVKELQDFCLDKGLNSSNMHVIVGLSWGNITGTQGKREEAGWVRFEDIVFLQAGNGAPELIYTVGPVSSPDLFIKIVMSKRPVEEAAVSRETWRKFLNPAGWKKNGKQIEYVGSRKWHKVATPADAKSIIGWAQVPCLAG